MAYEKVHFLVGDETACGMTLPSLMASSDDDYLSVMDNWNTPQLPPYHRCPECVAKTAKPQDGTPGWCSTCQAHYTGAWETHQKTWHHSNPPAPKAVEPDAPDEKYRETALTEWRVTPTPSWAATDGDYLREVECRYLFIPKIDLGKVVRELAALMTGKSLDTTRCAPQNPPSPESDYLEDRCLVVHHPGSAPCQKLAGHPGECLEAGPSAVSSLPEKREPPLTFLLEDLVAADE